MSKVLGVSPVGILKAEISGKPMTTSDVCNDIVKKTSVMGWILGKFIPAPKSWDGSKNGKFHPSKLNY